MTFVSRREDGWTRPGSRHSRDATSASLDRTIVLRRIRPLEQLAADSNPLTFASVAAAFIVLGVAAMLIPARRAARLDPVIALRCD